MTKRNCAIMKFAILLIIIIVMGLMHSVSARADGDDGYSVTFKTEYSHFLVDGQLTDTNTCKCYDEELPYFGLYGFKHSCVSNGKYWYFKSDFGVTSGGLQDGATNGMVFVGWKIRGGDETIYKYEDEIFKLEINEDIILDAVWEKACNVTMHTDVCGYKHQGKNYRTLLRVFPEGKYKVNAYSFVEEYTDEYDEDPEYNDTLNYSHDQLPETYGKYIFKGYKIEGEGDTIYKPGDIIDLDKDITLIAVWDEGVIVTIDTEGEGWFGRTFNGVGITKRTGLFKKNSRWFFPNDGEYDYGLEYDYYADDNDYDNDYDYDYDNDKFDYVLPEEADPEDDGIYQAHALPRRYDGYILTGFKVKGSSDEIYRTSYLLTDEDVTFVPVWEKGSLITYDANGGRFKDYIPCFGETETEKHQSTHKKRDYYLSEGPDPRVNEYAFETILYGSDDLEKEGQVFYGWRKKGSDSDTLYERSFYVEGDTTFEAVWGEQATLYFDPNGGEWSYDDEEDYINENGLHTEFIPKGKEVDFPLPRYSPHKDGYIFEGWRRVDDNSEYTSYYDSIESDKDLTFKAIWAETCTITMDFNGGYYDYHGFDGDDHYDCFIYGPDEYSDDIGYYKPKRYYTIDMMTSKGYLLNTETISYRIYVEDKYYIKGWSTSKNGEPKWEFTPNGDMTLYAIWADLKTGEIVNLGGSESAATPTPSKAPVSTPTVNPTSIPTTPGFTPTLAPTVKPTVKPTTYPATSTVKPTPVQDSADKNKTTFSIKNKAVVKQSAKIKIKDKDKIKKITLNGKSIKIKKNKKTITIKLKSSKKLLKGKGKWNKLVVTDAKGNKKTIKFKTK
ncbi:Listeria/Bacterioides repeat-containing protein [Lachnospiraceae bacterium]|nr:Listeria/Bacterioides repeat-containing protein [Lachnospiraceae bacterium]